MICISEVTDISPGNLDQFTTIEIVSWNTFIRMEKTIKEICPEPPTRYFHRIELWKPDSPNDKLFQRICNKGKCLNLFSKAITSHNHQQIFTSQRKQKVFRKISFIFFLDILFSTIIVTEDNHLPGYWSSFPSNISEFYLVFFLMFLINVFLLVEIKHKGNMNYNTELNFIILKCDSNSNVFSQFDFLHHCYILSECIF